MSAAITLRCPHCRKEKPYERAVDPRVPASVAIIAIICPECDDGDFHEERWFDSDGVELDQSCEALPPASALARGGV